MPPIQIAFVTDTIESPTGGTERQLLALLNGLDCQEFRAHLVCLRGSDWMNGERFAFPVTTYQVPRFRQAAALAALWRFRRLCQEVPFHIVQTFTTDGNLFGTLGGALARGPVVVSSRRNVGHWLDRKQLALLKVLRRWTDYYLANSRAAASHARDVEGVGPDRIEVIRNGLEFADLGVRSSELGLHTRESWGIGPEVCLVGTVANLRPVKNLDEFIAAAGMLAADHPELHFVVVGEGPCRTALEALIRALRLKDRFHLIGEMFDVRPALAAFDIGIQCSRAESLSNSLIEAMAAGLPVVASDIPGNAEVLKHNESGLLYPSGRPEALAQALSRLVGDASLRERLSTCARRTALADFSMSRCLKDHAAFYRRIAAKRPKH